MLSAVTDSRRDYVLDKLSARNANRPLSGTGSSGLRLPRFRTVRRYHELYIYNRLEPGLGLFTKQGVVVESG